MICQLMRDLFRADVLLNLLLNAIQYKCTGVVAAGANKVELPIET